MFFGDALRCLRVVMDFKVAWDNYLNIRDRKLPGIIISAFENVS